MDSLTLNRILTIISIDFRFANRFVSISIRPVKISSFALILIKVGFTFAILSHAGSRKMDDNTHLGEWNSAKHSMACSGPTPCSTLKQFFDVSFDYDNHDRVNSCFSSFSWIICMDDSRLN